MVLQVLLLISIILQMAAAIIAIRLMSRTKYNFSWILFSVAFVAMAAIRCAEYIQAVWEKDLSVPQDFFVWMGVVTSLCFAVGVFFIQKIFNWLDRLSFQQHLTEKRILNTVLRTEEKERQRFSKELHDGLGPLLSSAKLSLSALRRKDTDASSLEIIDNTNYVIEEAIRTLREISNNLSPHILNDFGLARGVGNFINKLPSLGDYKIEYTSNLKNRRFDTDVEAILYRVICELINNSIKHSGGTLINLSVNVEDEVLKVDYTDNGRGFNPDAMLDVGMGLSNIASRISSLKGTYDISSARGKGMKAAISVNLKEKNEIRQK